MKSRIVAIFVAAAALVLASCSDTLGWSVVLWGNEENGLRDGELVQVFVRSNITHTYIIEHPDGRGRAEIPLWQITEPDGKSRAEDAAAVLAECARTFASVKLDGLPIRAEPANTSKQVYRLREKEIIRVLYRGEGAEVTNSKGTIQGDWYRVLTSDGTQGWCFSYNLDIYRSEEGGRREEAAEASSSDGEGAELARICSVRWWPAEFSELVRAKRIDLKRMDASFGAFIDMNEGTVSVRTADDDLSWKFGGARPRSGGKFLLEGANVTLAPMGETELVVTYQDEGKPKNARFVSLGEDIGALIEKERRRRSDELSKIVSMGQRYKSSSYGTLTISPSGTFGWRDFSLLVPGVISESARGSGTVSVEYFLSDSLKSSYDGILTFRFSGMEKEANFLYKLTGSGLRLEDAGKAVVKNNVVTGRGASALVLFFEVQ